MKYALILIFLISLGCATNKPTDVKNLSLFHGFYVLCYKTELRRWPGTFADMNTFEPKTEQCGSLNELAELNGGEIWAKYPTTRFVISEDSEQIRIQAKVVEQLVNNLLVPIEPRPIEMLVIVTKTP